MDLLMGLSSLSLASVAATIELCLATTVSCFSCHDDSWPSFALAVPRQHTVWPGCDTPGQNLFWEDAPSACFLALDPCRIPLSSPPCPVTSDGDSLLRVHTTVPMPRGPSSRANCEAAWPPANKPGFRRRIQDSSPVRLHPLCSSCSSLAKGHGPMHHGYHDYLSYIPDIPPPPAVRENVSFTSGWLGRCTVTVRSHWPPMPRF